MELGDGDCTPEMQRGACMTWIHPGPICPYCLTDVDEHDAHCTEVDTENSEDDEDMDSAEPDAKRTRCE